MNLFDLFLSAYLSRQREMQVNDGSARREMVAASDEIISKHPRKENECRSQAVELQRQLMRSSMIENETNATTFEKKQEKIGHIKTTNQGCQVKVKELHHSKQSIKRKMARLTDQLDKRPVRGGNGPLEYDAIDLASVSAKEARDVLQQDCLGKPSTNLNPNR